MFRAGSSSLFSSGEFELIMRVKASMACCVLLAALGLAGCGKTVSEGTHGLQADGSYRLTSQERSENCSAVRQKMRRMADETVAYDMQTSKEVASSVMWGILFGVAGAATYRMASDAGEAGKLAKRNRAKLAAYNESLSARGCPTWNYEAHMNNKQAAINAKYAERRRKNMETLR